jgi:hypothetical protein
MTRTASKLLAIGLAALTGLGALFLDTDFLVIKVDGALPVLKLDRLVSEANARIGRPLTPLSYAGVARRTTRRVVRRNVYGGGVYGAGCVQVVNAYGQIITRCY